MFTNVGVARERSVGNRSRRITTVQPQCGSSRTTPRGKAWPAERIVGTTCLQAAVHQQRDAKPSVERMRARDDEPFVEVGGDQRERLPEVPQRVVRLQEGDKDLLPAQAIECQLLGRHGGEE